MRYKKLIRKTRRELRHPKKLLKYTDLYLPIRDDVKNDESESQRSSKEI